VYSVTPTALPWVRGFSKSPTAAPWAFPSEFEPSIIHRASPPDFFFPSNRPNRFSLCGFPSKMAGDVSRTMSSHTAPVSPIDPSPPAEAARMPRPGFWQRPAVQNFLPLGTSLVFHAGIVVIGILGFRTYQKLTEPMRQQIIVPEAAIVEGGEVGGIPNPGLGGDPNMTAAQNVDPNVNVADGWSKQRNQSLTSTLMAGSNDATDSVIGLGTHNGVAGNGTAGNGNGGDAGGSLAPFGVPGGGQGLGPQSPFMGISGNATKVVYICDASGSMMSVFWRVKDELHKAVDVLRPMQGFNVIFFSDADLTALSKTDLVMANPQNKRKAFELAEKMSAAGTTDPLPAIRLAFAQKPQLIYVLTDGFDQVVSFDAVIEEFHKLNADKKVKVNTILIRGADDPELERVVKTIAAENGGVCKIVDRQDM
jgi:hypothetical protein